MDVQIPKGGKYLAIRIPELYAKPLKMDQDSLVDLVAGKRIARPLDEKEYSLDQFLTGITEQNLLQKLKSEMPSRWKLGHVS